jgi:putative transposase
MTDTIDAVTDGDERVDQQALAEQLLAEAKANNVELIGPGGLLNQLTKRVLETALEAEMTEHLGYDKHDPAGRGSGNSRNGVRSKTVLTEIGPVDIDVPRDVDASFEPAIVRKRQRRLDGVNQIVLSLASRGLTTGEISAHFAEVYGASISKETISKITDAVLEEMTEWSNRPLDPVYPVIFVDAIVVKVRDGQVRNKPMYVVMGVTVNGERDILGIWAGDGGEGAKFWLSVFTEIRNRGVADVCIAVCDGLKGLPDAVTTVWPLAVVQQSSVHHGGGGIVPSVTCAAVVRTCAAVLPSRSRCRPVRSRRWRALHLPAGAAPMLSAEMSVRRGRPARSGVTWAGEEACGWVLTDPTRCGGMSPTRWCSREWIGVVRSTSCV